MAEINPLLNSTSAGKLAQKLDAADGKQDGKISASVWNSFVKDKGGKSIKNYIEVESAMNSLTSYVVKNSKSSGTGTKDLMKSWLGSVEEAEPPKDASPVSPAKPSEPAKPAEPAKPVDPTRDPNPPARDPNPPARDANPPARDPNPPAKEPDTRLQTDISVPNPLFAGKEIKKGDSTYVYDENGYLDEIRDSSGNTTLSVSRKDDGSVARYYRFEYDSSGNTTLCTYYGPDGSVYEYHRYEYDSSGNETLDIYYGSDGIVNYYDRTEYNSSGDETLKTNYDFYGSVRWYYRYEYDSSGNMTSSTWYNPDGTEYEY